MELKDELAKLSKANDELESKLEAFGNESAPKSDPYYFIERIPVEIRNQIYGYLLIDSSHIQGSLGPQ
jgi:hypothetical protein